MFHDYPYKITFLPFRHTEETKMSYLVSETERTNREQSAAAEARKPPVLILFYNMVKLMN